MNNFYKEKEWLLNEKYGGITSEAFNNDVLRLENGEPVGYVIGWVPFLGYPIDLSERPLIPRVETEYWTEKAFREIRDSYGTEKSLHCLDIFSGSGCIGIATLLKLPNAVVDFADKEEKAILQIEKNLTLNLIDPSRYRIFKSDVFSTIQNKHRYNIIFANPPYIAKENKKHVALSVFDFEPHSALFADDNGLSLIKTVVEQAPLFLTPQGSLYVEYDDIQKEKIELWLSEQNMQGTFYRDQFNAWRWVRISYT